MSSSSLQNFIEVFLHEFGHFVYFEYLTKEARTFFDAGWDIVNQKNEELDLKKRYKNRIEVFELGLDKVRWDYKKYYQTLEGLDKVLFSYMLRELGYVSTPKQLRITEEGKAYATLRNGSYHKDLDTWEGAHNFEQLLQTFGYHVRWMWPDKLWDLYSLKDPVAWANARGGDLIRDWLSHDRGYEDIGDLRDLGWYSKLATTLEGVNLEKIEAFAEINKSLLEDLEKAKDALQIPTQYGRTNVHEDFAETFYIFVLYPKGAALSKEARWRMGRTLGMSASQGRPVIKVARKKLL